MVMIIVEFRNSKFHVFENIFGTLNGSRFFIVSPQRFLQFICGDSVSRGHVQVLWSDKMCHGVLENGEGGVILDDRCDPSNSLEFINCHWIVIGKSDICLLIETTNIIGKIELTGKK